MHRITVSLVVIALLVGLVGFAYFFLLRKTERWVVYYTDALPASAFSYYHVVVFDREKHPPLSPLIAEEKTLLGYISLGEAETYRSNFTSIKEAGLLLGTGQEWKGNPVIDTRNPAWQAMVLDELIPALLKKGFDGIMIDTVDSIVWLENNNPSRYSGMKTAMVTLIKTIRARYPAIKIMLNRGFDILPQVAGDIDMFLAESTLSTLDHASKEFVLLSPAEREHYLRLLKAAKAKSPRLKIYTVDYWPTGDIEGVKKIYATQRRAGFIPYVSTMDLQAHTPEPQ